MSDEIKVGNETYISSRRASETTGYARDYIGQLARKGLIEARRIGGLWYISEQSLKAYKQEAESLKPEPPQNTKHREEPETIVSFDGKEYISAIKAAELTGYHKDYVGQLARGEKIPSRQIGTRWYIDRNLLLAHKKEKDALLAAVQSESVGIRPPKVAPINLTDTSYSGAGPYMRYTHDEQNLMPLINSEYDERQSVYRHDEAPISARESVINSIPIRKPESQKSQNSRQMQEALPHISSVEPRAVRSRRQNLNAARITAVVATIVIVIVVGYISFESSAIYTEINPAETGLALSARVADVLSKAGDVIENIVSPEIIYDRSR